MLMVRIPRASLVSGPFLGLTVLTLVGAVLMLNGPVGAAAEPPDVATLQRLTAEAHSVVVGRARSVQSTWQENEHGDRIIQSAVLVEVDETLKGRPERSHWLRLEGGTIDGVTLEVSGEPELRVGERAVLFLENERPNVGRVLGGDEGVLALDDQDFVRGTSLRLDEIRQFARGMGR
jgi:hypothetical protein